MRRLRYKNVAIYVDNSNNKDAPVNGISKTKVIDRPIKIFRARVQDLGIFAWFGWVPTGGDIGDRPTSDDPHPFPSKVYSRFGRIKSLELWIKQGTNSVSEGAR